MIELTYRHADSDEQAWDCLVKLELKDGTTDVEQIPIVTADETTMGEVLAHITQIYDKEIAQTNTEILSYDVTSLAKVKRCACCNILIDEKETYCQTHKQAVESILKRWDKDVNGI